MDASAATGGSLTAREQYERLLVFGRRSLRHWRAAVFALIANATVAVVVAWTRPPLYKSETVLLYHEQIRTGYGSEEPASQDRARRTGARLSEIVMSRPRLQQLIEEFKLYPGIADRGDITDAVQELQKHLTFQMREGDTFSISFEGEDPKRVQAVVLRMAESLIQEGSKSRSEQAQGTKLFLDEEEKRNEEELKRKERELAQFLSKHPEFASAQDSSGRLRASAASDPSNPKSDPALQALEREASRIRQRLLGGEVRPEPRDAPVNPLKQEAENELRAAQRELSEKLSSLTERHPDVLAAKARVARAQAELKRILEALGAPVPQVAPKPTTAEDRAALQAQLQKVEHEISARRGAAKPAGSGNASSWIVALETDWARLGREVEEARERHRGIAQKQFAAAMAASAAQGSAQMMVMEPAYLPQLPVKKARRSFVLGIGLGVAVVTGVGLMLVLALLDDRVIDGVELEGLKLGSVLVVIPASGRSGQV